MNVLVVGAGALGRVFGGRLAAGGASVSVLVKPGQRSAAERGYPLLRLHRVRSAVPAMFTPARVFADAGEVTGDWDAVWLCVHSPALGEHWIEALRARIGSASVVTIGQGLSDRTALERHWPSAQILELVPSLLAFEENTPAIAYWVPPGVPLQVAGEPGRAKQIVGALRRGGLAAWYTGTRGRGSLMAALNLPYFVALETAGWSFDRLETQLELPAAAAREAARVTAKALSTAPPPSLATSPPVVRIGLRVLRWLAPFDFEQYARRHFTKIGAQTREMLDVWIETARSFGLSSAHIEQLRSALPPLLQAASATAGRTRTQEGGTNAP
jgi:hypothetical protein